jgi:hypothetical protein
MMRHIVLAVALVPACTVSDDGVGPAGERDLSQYVDPDSGKADEPRRCGESTCLASQCGHDCDAGELCDRMCFPGSDHSGDFVSFSVSGGASMQLDTRTLPGPARYAQFDNIVIAGSDLWEFRDDFGAPVTRNGLEIMYWDIIQSGIAASNPFQHGPHVTIYIDDFMGPGEYKASATVSQARSRSVVGGPITGHRYWGKDCTATVTAAADGGLDGAVRCGTIAAIDGGSGNVSVQGAFHLAPTSIDRPRFFTK